MAPQKIPLTALPRELAQAYPGSSVPYRRCYALTQDGRLAASQQNGRWFIDRADLPGVAEVLGLSAPPAKAPKARSTSSAASTAVAA